ncbi:MAG TPA: VOC family protein [Solirubrobacteraceae bacterium]|nr:VOC family protein [Solirubrobacteraceae bacterium]
MGDTAHPNIFPSLHYQDASAAIEWLTSAFGFEEKAVYRGEDGVVHHAELRLGAGLIMLGQQRADGWMGDRTLDPLTSPLGIYVVVADPDAHHARAKAAGAEIVRELTDQAYGGRDYSVRDVEGNLWSFGSYDPYVPASK